MRRAYITMVRSDVEGDEGRRGAFNTPSYRQIDDLLSSTLGMVKQSSSWKWKNQSNGTVLEKLRGMIETRGEIVHGKEPAVQVDSAYLKKHRDFVRRLAAVIDSSVINHVDGFTTEPLRG